MDHFEGTHLAALLGLLSGVVLGLAARRARFCTLGAIEDALYANSWTRIRMWAVALSTAIAGTFLCAEFGLIDLGQSLYAQMEWNPTGSVLGGLLFGYGMAMAGNCGYGALARLGGGDLRSLIIVIAIGIAAYMTIGGPLSGARVALFPNADAGPETITSYTELAQSYLQLPPLAVALLIAGGLAYWALRDPDLRASPALIIWSALVGLAVILGWVGTTFLASESLDLLRVQSHSFTRPLGESILYLMASSGTPLSFTIGSVAGVVSGAFIGSVSRGHFRWEACDDAQELGRQILGGMLMGVGGVLALGCSVGQGLTAFSTLAISAPIVLTSICVGAALGLRHLIQGFAFSSTN